MPGAQPDNDPLTNLSVPQINGESDRIGGPEGYRRSMLARSRDMGAAYRENDFRIDVDAAHNIPTSLTHKYAREFALADRRMEDRKKSWGEHWKMNVNYDYDNDPRFREWAADKERAKEVLHIHFLDDWLDDPIMLCSHAMKVTTTLGGAQGAWRATNLWRGFDQHYAKLHGVTFRSLLLQEVAMGIVRGAGIGIAYGLGAFVGDGVYRIYDSLYVSYTIARDRRKWQGVASAGIVAGAFGSGAMALMALRLVSWTAMGMMVLGGISFGAVTGLLTGYFVYKPHQDKFPNDYATPWFKPWNQRQLAWAGSMRGRYV